MKAGPHFVDCEPGWPVLPPQPAADEYTWELPTGAFTEAEVREAQAPMLDAVWPDGSDVFQVIGQRPFEPFSGPALVAPPPAAAERALAVTCHPGRIADGFVSSPTSAQAAAPVSAAIVEARLYRVTESKGVTVRWDSEPNAKSATC